MLYQYQKYLLQVTKFSFKITSLFAVDPGMQDTIHISIWMWHCPRVMFKLHIPLFSKAVLHLTLNIK